MRLYHRTSLAAAQAILRDGFRDATGRYGTDLQFTGVWLSEELMEINDGVEGDALLAVDIAEGVVDEYEWIEEGKVTREWLVPASLISAHAQIKIVEEE